MTGHNGGGAGDVDFVWEAYDSDPSETPPEDWSDLDASTHDMWDAKRRHEDIQRQEMQARPTKDRQTAERIESGAITQHDGLLDECEDCHHIKRGRWVEHLDGSGEWFCCYDCEPDQ